MIRFQTKLKVKVEVQIRIKSVKTNYNTEIHGFSDAVEKVYSAVIYIIYKGMILDNGNISDSSIRVAPFKIL